MPSSGGPATHAPPGEPGTGHVVLRGSTRDAAAGAAPERLTHLYLLSDPALSELALEALLDEILTRIRGILEVDTVAVLLLDPECDELVARAAKGLEEEVRRGVRIPIGRGFAGRIAAERAPIFIPDIEHADVVNPILREMGIRALLGVPLIAEGRLLGVLHVGSLTPRTFSLADGALLELAAARVAPGIERARLFDALEREHRAAVALQRSLLPDALPQLVDVDVAVRYLPARDEVGGDWYDVVPLPGDRVGIVIGDVVGHGVRAAAVMAQLRTALRAYALDGYGPAAVLERLDRLLQLTHRTGMATVAYAVLDPAGDELCFASAGHPPALLVGADGARFAETPVFPPLGARPHPTYEQTSIAIAPGTTVLLYTDGLIEQRGEPLGVGLERLRVAGGAGDPSPEVLCSRVLDELVHGGLADDDIALVALAPVVPAETLLIRVPAERQVLAPVRRQLRSWLRAQGAGERESVAIVLAVGEACANAVEHAYGPAAARFELHARRDGDDLEIVVRDAGRWRDTSQSGHRGRGLAIMRSVMDSVDVQRGDLGTTVTMRRSLGRTS